MHCMAIDKIQIVIGCSLMQHPSHEVAVLVGIRVRPGTKGSCLLPRLLRGVVPEQKVDEGTLGVVRVLSIEHSVVQVERARAGHELAHAQRGQFLAADFTFGKTDDSITKDFGETIAATSKKIGDSVLKKA